jgi:hypothetical protein
MGQIPDHSPAVHLSMSPFMVASSTLVQHKQDEITFFQHSDVLLVERGSPTTDTTTTSQPN